MQTYIDKGFSKKTAQLAVDDLAKNGTVMLELERELGIDPDDLTSPWAAAVASAISFTAGSIIPLLTIWLAPASMQLWLTAGAVLLSLILTGTLSARAGQANKTRAALRVVVWGIGAMAITYAVGHLISVSI
jgi:VIT1/CCC1 family predicted Fe2+/Mn2+ transporter